MTSPVFDVVQVLQNYWDTIRGDQRCPLARKFDPGAIRMILPGTFMLRWERDRGYRYTLAGSLYGALFGRTLKNQAFDSHFHSRDRDAICKVLTGMREHHHLASIGFIGRTDTNKSLPCELALFPLSAASADAQLIVGACAFDSSPYWIGLNPITRLSVEFLKSWAPDQVQSRSVERPMPHAPELTRTGGVMPAHSLPRIRFSNEKPAVFATRPVLRVLRGGRAGPTAAVGRSHDRNRASSGLCSDDR